MSKTHDPLEQSGKHIEDDDEVDDDFAGTLHNTLKSITARDSLIVQLPDAVNYKNERHLYWLTYRHLDIYEFFSHG